MGGGRVMEMKVTKVTVKMDDPAKGERVATVEVEIGGTLRVGGFAVYPDRVGMGLRVLPPSSKQADGRRVPIFSSAGGFLEREITVAVLEEMKRMGK